MFIIVSPLLFLHKGYNTFYIKYGAFNVDYFLILTFSYQEIQENLMSINLKI